MDREEKPEVSEAEVKRRRNPSQEQIAQYGKRLPYIVVALDKAARVVGNGRQHRPEVCHEGEPYETSCIRPAPRLPQPAIR